jgi:hypothetical protein
LLLPNAYIPGLAEGGAAAALIVLLVWGAFRLGKDELRPAGRAPWSAAWPFAVIGALGAAVQFWSATGWRDMGAPAPVGAALIVAVWAGALIALRKLISAGSWRRDLAFLFAGVVVFFALRDLLLPNASGMGEVGAAALIGLFIVYRKLRPAQQRPATGAP